MSWLALKYKWLLHRGFSSFNSKTLAACASSVHRLLAKRTFQIVNSLYSIVVVLPYVLMCCFPRFSVVISKRLRSTEKDAVVAQVSKKQFVCNFLYSLQLFHGTGLYLCVVTPQLIERNRLSKPAD